MESSSATRTRKLQKPRHAANGGGGAGSAKSSWCCSFTNPPRSPESFSLSKTPRNFPPNLSQTLSKSLTPNSFPNSPLSSKSGLSIVGRIDPRRMLSPGRVSPIDSDSFRAPAPAPALALITNADAEPAPHEALNLGEVIGGGEKESSQTSVGRALDVRLNLKGKRGACLALELSSEVLARNSTFFARFISDHIQKKLGDLCKIEVPEVENLGVFRDTVELMFEDDITRRLFKVGAYRAIDILQVSADIEFSRGVLSCLKYLEAVPWAEEEEEKLRRVFTKFKFDDDASEEILARLNPHDSTGSQQNLASQLVWSITRCANPKARNELKSMVKGLLCNSSIYDKDHQDIEKEELYDVSRSCLGSLTTLLEEATSTAHHEPASGKTHSDKPLVESISWQVDNLNWLLEILLNWQIAEDLVDIWADQEELLRMHGRASPLIRYELSRVSAALFIAMGTRKLQCRSESRLKLFQTWFEPTLLDFGWLQRCKKGLDMKELEEAIGQALLTLPLQQQHTLFMMWFRHLSKHGNDSPNLSKSFQTWWKRTFLRGNEIHGVESR